MTPTRMLSEEAPSRWRRIQLKEWSPLGFPTALHLLRGGGLIAVRCQQAGMYFPSFAGSGVWLFIMVQVSTECTGLSHRSHFRSDPVRVQSTHRIGTGRRLPRQRDAPCGTRLQRANGKSGWEFRAPCEPSGIVPSHSGALSFHCTHRTVFPALLPASGVARFLSRQDVPASAGPPLQGAHLARTHRPRALEDVRTLGTIHQPAPTWVTEGRDPSS